MENQTETSRFAVIIIFWLSFLISYLIIGVAALLSGTFILENYWSTTPIPIVHWVIFIFGGLYVMICGVILYLKVFA